MPDDLDNAEPQTVDPLDQAFAAYLRSCDEGVIESREVFLAKYPELASQLKELIEAADMIGQFSSGRSLPRSDSTSRALSFSYDGSETVAMRIPSPNESGADPAATLPMAHRAEGDTGPTLPYDLGDYLLMDVIGRGGMGVVYLAKQTELDRMVAVKMIRSGILADESEVRRFYTEAQAAARLHHPGIVSVYQFGRRAGHHFFSMEYVRGTDLQKKINRETLSIHDAARYVRDVARAIHHAHDKGVLHRDLKPANVLINESDQVLVTDFGLAKHIDNDGGITASNAAIGTPHYMAPEQADGESDSASRESDVYALGAYIVRRVDRTATHRCRYHHANISESHSRSGTPGSFDTPRCTGGFGNDHRKVLRETTSQALCDCGRRWQTNWMRTWMDVRSKPVQGSSRSKCGNGSRESRSWAP